MRLYRAVWYGVMMAGVMVGAALTLLAWPVPALVALFAVSGSVVAVGSTAQRLGEAGPLPGAARAGLACRRGAVGGAVTVGVAGLAMGLQIWVLPLVLVAALASPPMLHHWRGAAS